MAECTATPSIKSGAVLCVVSPSTDCFDLSRLVVYLAHAPLFFRYFVVGHRCFICLILVISDHGYLCCLQTHRIGQGRLQQEKVSFNDDLQDRVMIFVWGFEVVQPPARSRLLGGLVLGEFRVK